MRHRIAAAIAAIGLLFVLVAPAIAGGWAEIVADAPAAEPPREGQPTEVGFTVLQHGETPAPTEVPTVHFTNLVTGETLDIVARNDRPDGHFVATTTLPEAGYWTWQVTLRDLISEHTAQAMTVHTASGALPRIDPATTLAAVDRARRDVEVRLDAKYLPAIERLDAALRAEQAMSQRLDRQLQALSEADATGTSAPITPGTPTLAVLALAVLAGAVAGYGAAWISRRPRGGVVLSPAPRGADPV